MKKNLSALIAGTIFGFGLIVSGMSNPDKVMNFLNLVGAWDASLLFVLGGAVITTFIGYRVVLKREQPILDKEFFVPVNSLVDKKLVLGAALFGAGWGMTGFCPGPALTGLAFGVFEPFLFIISMLFGYLVMHKLTKS